MTPEERENYATVIKQQQERMAGDTLKLLNQIAQEIPRPYVHPWGRIFNKSIRYILFDGVEAVIQVEIGLPGWEEQDTHVQRLDAREKGYKRRFSRHR